MAALSQQLPLRLIELRMRYLVSAAWKAVLQYGLPRSPWKIIPASGLRRNQAMRSASMTLSHRMCGFIDQPTPWLAGGGHLELALAPGPDAVQCWWRGLGSPVLDELVGQSRAGSAQFFIAMRG